MQLLCRSGETASAFNGIQDSQGIETKTHGCSNSLNDLVEILRYSRLLYKDTFASIRSWYWTRPGDP